MSGAEERLLAERIAAYLERNPNASDTVEGITRWWLSSDLGAGSVDDVERVLDQLVAAGVLVRKLKPDHEWIYGLAPERRAGGPSDNGKGR